MKHIFNNTFLIFMISIFFLTNCEQDQTELETNESLESREYSTTLTGAFVQGEELFASNKDLDLFLRSQFGSRDQIASEDVSSSVHDFTIKTNDIQVITSDTYTSYTFEVVRDSYDIYTAENYILTIYNHGGYTQLLANYPLEEVDGKLVYNINTATIISISDPSLLVTENTSPCGNTSEEILEWDSTAGDCISFNCSGTTGDGTHSPGEPCDAQGSDRAFEICPGGWVVTGCISSGGGGGNPSGGNDPSDDTTNGGSNNDDPIDNPFNEEEEVPLVPVIPGWQQIVNCMNTHAFTGFGGNGLAQLSNTEISWLQSALRDVTSPMLNYLDGNACSSLSANFNDLAIDELIDDAEIEYEEKIINKFTGKTKCVYNKIKSQQMVRKLLNKFQETNSPARLRMEMADLGHVYAETHQPDANDLIVIQINSNTTSPFGAPYQPNVLLAQTIFHEIIHAEFFREIVKAIGAGNYDGATAQEIISALSTSNYFTLYEHYRRYKDWSHVFMSRYFRESIAQVTQEYVTGVSLSNNQQPDQLYMDLAWRGLRIPGSVPAWDQLTNAQRVAINNVINTYTEANKNETCTE